MKCSIERGVKVNVQLKLDEYIPLKILCEGRVEPVDYVSCSKGTQSVLEITVGLQSRLIQKITLLLCKEYHVLDRKMGNEQLESVNANVTFREYDNVETSIFTTNLYKDGIQIVISEDKTTRFVKMDTIYIGLSSTHDMTEIRMQPLNHKELAHIKKELEYQ